MRMLTACFEIWVRKASCRVFSCHMFTAPQRQLPHSPLTMTRAGAISRESRWFTISFTLKAMKIVTQVYDAYYKFSSLALQLLLKLLSLKTGPHM